MRRGTIALIAAASLVLAGSAYVGHRLATGGAATEVGVADALERFREQVDETSPTTPAPATPTPATPAPATPAPVTPAPVPETVETQPTTAAVERPTTTTEPDVVASLPTPGVYQYATTGFDQIDTLTGARREYPSITTMTVVPHDCGVRLRWDVAVERWNTWDWCLDGDAVGQTGWVAYHEFFGVAGVNDYTCDGDPRPLDAPAGTIWTMTCRMGDRTTSSFTGTVIDRTTLTVAETPIPVLHLRYDVEVVGESTGTQTIMGWYRIADGLPVREQLTTSTQQSTVIGTANFDESYTIDLLTPTPAS